MYFRRFASSTEILTGSFLVFFSNPGGFLFGDLTPPLTRPPNRPASSTKLVASFERTPPPRNFSSLVTVVPALILMNSPGRSGSSYQSISMTLGFVSYPGGTSKMTGFRFFSSLPMSAKTSRDRLPSFFSLPALMPLFGASPSGSAAVSGLFSQWTAETHLKASLTPGSRPKL